MHIDAAAIDLDARLGNRPLTEQSLETRSPASDIPDDMDAEIGIDRYDATARFARHQSLARGRHGVDDERIGSDGYGRHFARQTAGKLGRDQRSIRRALTIKGVVRLPVGQGDDHAERGRQGSWHHEAGVDPRLCELADEVAAKEVFGHLRQEPQLASQAGDAGRHVEGGASRNRLRREADPRRTVDE
jgi:hypothetical protein